MKRHLKTLVAPKTWPLPRKRYGKFVTRPLPSGVTLDYTLPINIALKLLNKAETSKEVKYIIHNHKVLINSVRVRDHKTPISLFSVLSFPEIKEYYRLLISTKHKLYFKSIPEEEANLLIARVNNKTVIKNNLLQINLSNGWNLLYDRLKDTITNGINTYDSVLLDVNNKKPLKILRLAKGAKVFILKGKHVGLVGTFQEFEKAAEKQKQKRLTVVDVDNNKLIVNLHNLIVVGSEKPEITVK